jgi:hypothetical protein
MARTDLPLSILITERCGELELSRSGLVTRCGYRNVSKGLRRLDQVYAGDLEKAASLLRGLPKALNLSPETVQRAIDETVQQIAAEAEARWRASFEPCAYLLGTSKTPSQIFIFGITGGAERWLRIPLDLLQPPLTYADQALAVVQQTPIVKFFGPTTGFVVNYTPDHAVRFDLNGRPVETLTRAYKPGEVTLFLRNRRFSPESLGRVMGTIAQLES